MNLWTAESVTCISGCKIFRRACSLRKKNGVYKNEVIQTTRKHTVNELNDPWEGRNRRRFSVRCLLLHYSAAFWQDAAILISGILKHIEPDFEIQRTVILKRFIMIQWKRFWKEAVFLPKMHISCWRSSEKHADTFTLWCDAFVTGSAL